MWENLLGPMQQTGLVGNAMANYQPQMESLERIMAQQHCPNYADAFTHWIAQRFDEIDKEQRRTLPERFADFSRRLDAALVRHGLA